MILRPCSGAKHEFGRDERSLKIAVSGQHIHGNGGLNVGWIHVFFAEDSDSRYGASVSRQTNDAPSYLARSHAADELRRAMSRGGFQERVDGHDVRWGGMVVERWEICASVFFSDKSVGRL